jgi:amino acid transporter
MAANNYEKDQFAIQGDTTPPHDHGIGNIVETKGAALGEAAGIYGDIETAERYGYVERNLKSRHIQFIALGGTFSSAKD